MIEGAHEGKGLGIQFLRHVERTRVLAILIEIFSDDYQRDLEVLRNELSSYSSELEKKPWFVAISKIDSADEDAHERIVALREELDVDVHAFSSVSGAGVPELKDIMWKMIGEEASQGKGKEE